MPIGIFTVGPIVCHLELVTLPHRNRPDTGFQGRAVHMYVPGAEVCTALAGQLWWQSREPV